MASPLLINETGICDNQSDRLPLASTARRKASLWRIFSIPQYRTSQIDAASRVIEEGHIASISAQPGGKLVYRRCRAAIIPLQAGGDNASGPKGARWLSRTLKQDLVKLR